MAGKEVAGGKPHLAAEAVIEGMREAVAIVDLDGTIRQVNSEFERGSGWKREEAIGKTPIELGIMSKEEGQTIEKEVKPKLMKESLVRDIETIVIRRDGTKFPALMSWTLMKDAEGQPTGIVIVTRDITEYKKVEEALKESEEKFRTFMETASDLMHILDKDGNITYVNESMARILGYSKEEMTGTHITQLLSKEALEKDFKPNWEKFITEGEINLETTFLTKDGKKYTVR